MTKITITRMQFERLKEVFDMYDTVDQVSIIETHESVLVQLQKWDTIPNQ